MNAPRRWLHSRREAYGLVITALALNAPLFVALLWRHLIDIDLSGVTVVYAGLVFLGYYGLLLFVIVSSVFWTTAFSARFATITAGVALGASVFYLVLNGTVYSIYRFHVDPFWMTYAMTQYSGLGIPRSVTVTALGVAVGIAVAQIGIFKIAGRINNKRRVSAIFLGTAVASLALSQVIHIVAYQRSDPRITQVTSALPFYYPATSRSNAIRYGHLVPFLAAPADARGADAQKTLRYPLTDIACIATPGEAHPNILILLLESWRYDTFNELVSPNMFALSQRSTVFTNHFSSGNATPHGVFGLFYGIHPTYWTAVKANSAAIDNPLLIDTLEASGYAFGIFADSHFDRHKIKETIFAGIRVNETFSGRTADMKDDDLTDDLIAFIEKQRRSDTPFFGFAFYKSTHYSYEYPDSSARFSPSRDLNIALLDDDRDPTPYLNDYRNAVAHVDRLIGRIVDRLEASGLLEQTVVIITSDHGEEFDDNRENYWGHTSNFTRFQTQVPMIVFVPGADPGRVSNATSHTDVPVTLLQEVLGCQTDPRSYSNGRNLFGDQDARRPIVVGGYASHAFIVDDDVYAVYPLRTRRYKLSDVTAHAATPDPDLMKQAIAETSRFFAR